VPDVGALAGDAEFAGDLGLGAALGEQFGGAQPPGFKGGAFFGRAGAGAAIGRHRRMLTHHPPGVTSTHELNKRAFERRKARNQLRTAMADPLRKLIEEDADASEALAAASRRREQDRSDQLTQTPEWPTVKIVERPSEAADAGGFEQPFDPPFPFHWEWHDPHLAAPVRSSADRHTGRIELDTFANDDRGWATAHAGFGVVLPRSDQVRSAVGRSHRREAHRYYVESDWPSGEALAEGGTEMTFFENGRLLEPPPAQDKRFRSRVSLGDDDADGWTGWAIAGPLEADFVMRAGRDYIINVGAWVSCSADGGFASAQIHTNVTRIIAFIVE
jgi:hypothetical protein